MGDASTGPANRTLILHWNGRTWARMPSPHPATAGRNNDLSAVGASSGRNAWAVGTFDGGSFLKPLILHWNGRKWVSVPGPGGGASDDELEGVYVISGGNAWAVGIRIAGTKRTGRALERPEVAEGPRPQHRTQPDPGRGRCFINQQRLGRRRIHRHPRQSPYPRHPLLLIVVQVRPAEVKITAQLSGRLPSHA